MLKWPVLVLHTRRKDITSDHEIFIRIWSINQPFTGTLEGFKDFIVGKALRTHGDSKRSTTPLNFAPHWCLAFLCGVWLACGTTQAEDLQCDVPASHDNCAVIIALRSTAADYWNQVASAVQTFHRDAGVTHHVFEESPLELKDILAEKQPRYLALM
jgi:hypothetical protein